MGLSFLLLMALSAVFVDCASIQAPQNAKQDDRLIEAERMEPENIQILKRANFNIGTYSRGSRSSNMNLEELARIGVSDMKPKSKVFRSWTW